jgi:hypothetical protein
VCLPDLLKFRLKFGSLAPADCEIMQVGQQANRPSVLIGLPLQDMYGDLIPDFRFASALVDRDIESCLPRLPLFVLPFPLGAVRSVAGLCPSHAHGPLPEDCPPYAVR